MRTQEGHVEAKEAILLQIYIKGLSKQHWGRTCDLWCCLVKMSLKVILISRPCVGVVGSCEEVAIGEGMMQDSICMLSRFHS